MIKKDSFKCRWLDYKGNTIIPVSDLNMRNIGFFSLLLVVDFVSFKNSIN